MAPMKVKVSKKGFMQLKSKGVGEKILAF